MNIRVTFKTIICENRDLDRSGGQLVAFLKSCRGIISLFFDAEYEAFEYKLWRF